jgi:tetratricopeptide (TPR) repeat protein
VRLELLADLGRLDEAEAEARKVLEKRPRDVAALCVLARTLEERGRREDALAEYDKVIAAWNGSDPAPHEIPLVGRAAVRATWLSANPGDDLIPDALRIVGEYLREHPDDHDAVLEYAEVFRADQGQQGQSTARKYYAQVLKANSEVAQARVGLARTDLVFYQQDKAVQGLERALQTNPKFVPALALLAAIHVGNGDYDKAETHIGKALEVNPRDRETLSVKAALHFIRGEEAAFEETRDRVLGQDPRYGLLYVRMAELVGERQRRYDVAAELARKAIEVDPSERSAYVVLGEALMNRGRTDEALEQFRIGVEKSKRYSDVHRDNWIEVLSVWMPRFSVVESEHFRIRIPLEEAGVMRHYLPDLLEEAHQTLTQKYGITVENPTHADSFDNVDDFSVRSVGTPGLPALGVCFGNTITLLGPTSRPMGQFSWSRTAWHEFAHVVTLQMSEGQVPRWLTEGLSVFEEQQRRERWGRDMEAELHSRWRNGRLLRMADINGAFRGPDIMFAYYQGGLIASHLQEARGFAVIPEMLKAFAKDRTTAQVFRDVLALDLAEYDRLFEDYVGTLVGEYHLVPRWDDRSMKAFEERVAKDKTDAEAWVRLGWGHLQRDREVDAGYALSRAEALAPDHPEVVLLQGRVALKARRADLAEERYNRFLALGGDDLSARLFLAERALAGGGSSAKAVEHLEAAKRCFPGYIQKDSPYLQLARLYRGERRMEDSIRELEAFAAIAAEHYPVRKELKAWYLGKKDWEAVARVSEEMNDVTPFGANVQGSDPPDLSLHRDWAKALQELGRLEEARRELAVQVELGRLVPEGDRLSSGVLEDILALGQLELDLGRPEEALVQALAALRLSPDHAGARMLKQRASEAGAGK